MRINSSSSNTIPDLAYPPPGFVQLFITLRCDRQCDFCFNRGLVPAQDITLHDFEKIIGIMQENGINEVDLLGGEPTLHPDFIRMAGIVHEHMQKASFSTNGGNLRVLEEFMELYPDRKIKPGISVNGEEVSPELNEFIMAYFPMVKSVSTRAAEIPANSRPYVHNKNIQYFLLYMDALDPQDLMKTISFPEFYRTLNDLHSLHPSVRGVHCGFLHPGLPSRCPAGTTKLSVMPDGSAYPCYLLSRHMEYRLGNILTDDFRAVWENPVLDFLRRPQKNRCPRRGCVLHAVCRGGCPAMGLTLKGDINAPDPRCAV